MLDQQQGAGGARDGPLGTALYRRPMPGGGYVEVELDGPPSPGLSGSGTPVHHGRIILERRADTERRYGHQAPVVAELAGDDRDELMADLFRLACDNAALARSLLRRQTAQTRAD